MHACISYTPVRGHYLLHIPNEIYFITSINNALFFWLPMPTGTHLATCDDVTGV